MIINLYLFKGIWEVENSRTAYDYYKNNEIEMKLIEFIYSYKETNKCSNINRLLKDFEKSFY